MKDWGVDINVELIEEQLVYSRVVAQIHPLARTSALLFVLAVTQDDIVVAFRASLGRRQPDLLVGRLLVDDVNTDIRSEVDGQNASLLVASVRQLTCPYANATRPYSYW